MLHPVDKPAWWRGQRPTRSPRGKATSGGIITGQAHASPEGEADDYGLRTWYFFKAEVADAELWLNDVHLVVAWSEFTSCHFRQRVKPVVNEHGFTAQGCFGNSPAIYRGCVFERVRFKALGGFTMGSAWFEDCSFINCRWNGHFANAASLVKCTFVGRMDGCVWFGPSAPTSSREHSPNVLQDNDFTRVQFTDNVGWRGSFPLQDQRWPEQFTPRVDG